MALSSGAFSTVAHGGRSHDGRSHDGPAASPRRPTPDPRLAAFAAELGAVELVWFRERRGQRLTAQLRADGVVELPNGEVFGDPSAAAQLASNAALRVDGWGVWRVGDGGPTLYQALGISPAEG